MTNISPTPLIPPSRIRIRCFWGYPWTIGRDIYWVTVADTRPNSLCQRSLCVSLSGNYTPTYIQCPSNVTFVRPASEGLSDDEREWRAKRTPAVVDGLHSYLKNVHITDFDIDVYINALGANESAVPVIGFTLSGGGTRAEMSAFGMIRAFDNRTADSINAGTGGLLQTATYVSGLSGGGSALGLVAMSDFQPLDTSLRQGLVNYTALPSTSPIINEIASKAEAGFKISISDIIAVGNNHQSLQIVNSSVNQYSRLWSDIQSFPGFSSGFTPMAILMLNEVIPAGLPGSASYNGTLIPALESKFNGTVYEANFGSWQGRANAFTPIQYIGAQYQNAQPINNTCVNGFDTAAFILGLAESQTNGVVGQFARRNKIPYPPNEDDCRLTPPQAFCMHIGPTRSRNMSILTLDSNRKRTCYWWTAVNFGRLENPLPPLLQKVRGLDFIVVNDAGGSELSTGWANGTTFHNSADMAKTFGLPFPTIPSVNTMLNLNHTLFPVFYGCYETDVPLMLYAADAPYTEYSNITALGTDYDNSQISLLWNNTLALYSQDSNQISANWTTCIACAAIQRSLERLGKETPDACKQCFDKYCWNGEVDNSEPGFLSPSLILDPSESWAEWNVSFYG
ncbi:FabD/lysophospholipase-like protein [Gymnopus androsaceus JB14]|uniref:Lysophospholipase n=1 Tax=Gymnopus androsaceus JB14 TaxID=1447944 RepID=A0A6A4GQS0_9AGAR|nr:FabD/lysophospholipase-like protein [Gymnopus androsaceus JB14]